MNKARLKTPVPCPVCGVEFYPWRRKRSGQPTCSMRCARTRTGFERRGQPCTAALAGRAAQLADEAACVGRRFGAKLTPREVAIYRYGVSVGVDRGYRQRKAAA